MVDMFQTRESVSMLESTGYDRKACSKDGCFDMCVARLCENEKLRVQHVIIRAHEFPCSRIPIVCAFKKIHLRTDTNLFTFRHPAQVWSYSTLLCDRIYLRGCVVSYVHCCFHTKNTINVEC